MWFKVCASLLCIRQVSVPNLKSPASDWKSPCLNLVSCVGVSKDITIQYNIYIHSVHTVDPAAEAVGI